MSYCKALQAAQNLIGVKFDPIATCEIALLLQINNDSGSHNSILRVGSEACPTHVLSMQKSVDPRTSKARAGRSDWCGPSS